MTGTATEVGKTWVGAVALRTLRAEGVAVAARKPAQSFAPGEGPTDAEVLGEATGEDPGVVCPRHRWYERALAPPMAAAHLGRPPFSVDELVAELAWPDGVEVGLVEGVGGPRSPIALDGDTVDLAAAVGADQVVLVAESGLGAINAVRLSVDAFSRWDPIVVLNRFDPGDQLHADNQRWLELDGLDVVIGPEGLVERLL